MKRFKDVEHLLRLAALFAAGLLVFGVARAEFVPATFGTLGHFRARAIDDIRAKPIEYASQNACADCPVLSGCAGFTGGAPCNRQRNLQQWKKARSAGWTLLACTEELVHDTI